MRGKKRTPEDIYRVMASWAINNSYAETARELGMPLSTVKDIVEANKDKEDFVQLRKNKKEEFSRKASIIIDKALKRLEREIDSEDNSIPVNHLTTVIGTLYDKKALAEGNPTSRTEIIGEDKLGKLAELAGYERKQ
jgi:DNA-binding transcriptional MerR regulator